MNKKYIIKKKSEISNVIRSKERSGNSYFVIYKKYNYKNVNFKFALSIGKKYGNAVARNKIKRQLRSIVRENKDKINRNIEFVIVIKPQANQLQYNEINESITDLLKKINIMETTKWKKVTEFCY